MEPKKTTFYCPTSAESHSYIGNFDFKYDFNSGINSLKMQIILFAIHHLEFAPDRPREIIIIL